MKYNAIVFVAR